ncbi:hypothetical protein ACI797_12430 [Geodermatophilus sp. SYSU D00691]
MRRAHRPPPPPDFGPLGWWERVLVAAGVMICTAGVLLAGGAVPW